MGKTTGKTIKSLKSIVILDIQKAILWLGALVCGLLLVYDENKFLNITLNITLPGYSFTLAYTYMNAAIVGGVMILCLLILIGYCLATFIKSILRRSNRFGIINVILVTLILATLIAVFIILALSALRFVKDFFSYLHADHSNETYDQALAKIDDLLKQCRNVFKLPAFLSGGACAVTICSAIFCGISAAKSK